MSPLNHFQTGQGHCVVNLQRWCKSSVYECSRYYTSNLIVNMHLLTECERGLQMSSKNRPTRQGIRNATMYKYLCFYDTSKSWVVSLVTTWNREKKLINDQTETNNKRRAERYEKQSKSLQSQSSGWIKQSVVGKMCERDKFKCRMKEQKEWRPVRLMTRMMNWISDRQQLIQDSLR